LIVDKIGWKTFIEFS